jgi:Ras-related protein Rab-8A
MEVSAKSNINVEKAFFALANQIKKRIIDSQGAAGGPQAGGVQRQGGGAVNVGAAQTDQGMGGKCC